MSPRKPAGSPRSPTAAIDPLRARHLGLGRRSIETPAGRIRVTVNEAESPLAWLARRTGRDGRALIEPVELAAGERLREDFTCAQLMPRVTSDWSNAVVGRQQGLSLASPADAAVAARQRVRHALDAVGPEFAGLLVDVCCFLKSLGDVERERRWPPRSAKLVLQLGLGRLARHYGFAAQARGRARAAVRTWLADDVHFAIDVGGDQPAP
jgi:hypothetical protein